MGGSSRWAAPARFLYARVTRGAMTLCELVTCVFCRGGIQGFVLRLRGWGRVQRVWGAGSFVKSWQCGCSCLPDSSVACLAGCEGRKYNKTDRRSGMEIT